MKVLLAVILAAMFTQAQAFGFAWNAYGSCSGCTKYIQENPAVAEEAAAYIVSGGESAISPELRQAMELVGEGIADVSDLDLAEGVIHYANPKN